MDIEFDPAKSAKNDRERGLPFERTADLDWSKALAFSDNRRVYGEERILALAPMEGRLFAVCYCIRGGKRRIISFRKDNDREERVYAEATADE